MFPDLAVVYEHPTWFAATFAALDRAGIAYTATPIAGHIFDPADMASPAPLIFNRIAMSSFLRSADHPIFYAQALFDHWSGMGARVLNGDVLALDASKARQMALIARLGLAGPATRVVHRRADLVRAATGLRFPVVVKADIGGSGAGIVRYDCLDQLGAAAADDTTPVGLNGVALVQEYVPRRGGTITRAETLGGRFLYALDIASDGDTFDLCPADACEVGRAAPVTIVESRPAPALIEAVEQIARAAALDVGGIEYMIDDRDGCPRFYDINALSNFVARPLDILGWDPHDRLVVWLRGMIDQRKAV